MKTVISIIIFASCLTALQAETPVEREFKQLREQRDKALAAVADPINRRYQASLEQLLRKATQGSDLETALKIKQEMGGTPVGTVASTNRTSEAATQTKKQLETALTGTRWTMTMNGKDQGTWQFNEGTLAGVETELVSWKASSKDTVTIKGWAVAKFDDKLGSFEANWGGGKLYRGQRIQQ